MLRGWPAARDQASAAGSRPMSIGWPDSPSCPGRCRISFMLVPIRADGRRPPTRLPRLRIGTRPARPAPAAGSLPRRHPGWAIGSQIRRVPCASPCMSPRRDRLLPIGWWRVPGREHGLVAPAAVVGVERERSGTCADGSSRADLGRQVVGRGARVRHRGKLTT
jgi:hypothetical protein